MRELVSVVQSLKDEARDPTYVRRLERLRDRFLEDKNLLLSQTKSLGETEDRLNALQYDVTKQQAAFMACWQEMTEQLSRRERVQFPPTSSDEKEEGSMSETSVLSTLDGYHSKVEDVNVARERLAHLEITHRERISELSDRPHYPYTGVQEAKRGA